MAALVGLTLWGEYQGGTLRTLDLGVAVVALVLVPVLLRRPVTGALALAVLAAVSPAATAPATMGTLHVAQRRDFRTAVAVGVAGFAAHAVRGLWRPVGGMSYGWWLVLMAVAHAGLIGWGALSRSRAALIASLRERAERAEAEQARRVAEARVAERTQIAREMHDVLAHRLSLLATYAGALEYRPDAAPEQLARAAGVVRESVHQALGELRDVVAVLRADEDGCAGPQPTVADLARLLDEAEGSGTDVELVDSLADRDELPATVSRTVYRVVQEGLTNARKHAPGRPVRLVLGGRAGSKVSIEMSNPMADAPFVRTPGTGTGLVGMAERVRLAGGELEYQGTGEDFRLAAWLPFHA
jgi:signal transduction histidine kinase